MFWKRNIFLRYREKKIRFSRIYSLSIAFPMWSNRQMCRIGSPRPTTIHRTHIYSSFVTLKLKRRCCFWSLWKRRTCSLSRDRINWYNCFHRNMSLQGVVSKRSSRLFCRSPWWVLDSICSVAMIIVDDGMSENMRRKQAIGLKLSVQWKRRRVLTTTATTTMKKKAWRRKWHEHSCKHENSKWGIEHERHLWFMTSVRLF